MEILAVRGAVPPHRHTQAEITDAFSNVIARGSLDEQALRRLHANAGVQHRSLVLPLTAYGELEDFGQTNDLFIQHAVKLGAQALEDAIKSAGLTPSDVDEIICATVTGVATPSLDARIAASSGCVPTCGGSPWWGWAVSPARPAWLACTTICWAAPTT
jgi:alkylresorcinol/alkylpyrone synthase